MWVERDGEESARVDHQGSAEDAQLGGRPSGVPAGVSRNNPYSYVEVRGTATLTEEGGRELIDRLARAYTGADRYTMDDGTDNVRVVVRITPDKVVFRA